MDVLRLFHLDQLPRAIYHLVMSRAHAIYKDRIGGSMKRVSIVGSGNVGANTAFFIAEKGIADVTLYDIQEGVPSGKALDIMEAAPIRTYRVRISGSDNTASIRGSDVIVLAAGSVRKPGMKREELFDENVEFISAAASNIKEIAPKAKVIILTEPIDPLTSVFVAESGMPRDFVMGLGGLLDSTRLGYAISRDLGVSLENVSALVIGHHGKDMIGLARYSCVSGVPVLNLMLPEHFESLVNETRQAGDFIVDMAKRSSAYYAPSAAAAELSDAICRNTRRVLSVSVQLNGEYEVEGAALSVPAVIGQNGVREVFLPKLTDEEMSRFQRSAQYLKSQIRRREQ